MLLTKNIKFVELVEHIGGGSYGAERAVARPFFLLLWATTISGPSTFELH